MSATHRLGLSSLSKDEEVLKHKLAAGTIGRACRFVRPYGAILGCFLSLVVLDASVGVVNPLIYRKLINQGILLGNSHLVIVLALTAAGISLLDSALTFAQRQLATHIGLQIVFDLRTRIFAHIQQMSIAFFSRARTGALVSRLNGDVSGVREAFTDLLSTAVGNLVTVTLVLTAMFALSWRLTLAALLLVPVFLWSARQVGKKIRTLTREMYDRAAEMNNLMVERFNVSGAMVCKIFGRPQEEVVTFSRQADRVRNLRHRSVIIEGASAGHPGRSDRPSRQPSRTCHPSGLRCRTCRKNLPGNCAPAFHSTTRRPNSGPAARNDCRARPA